MKWFNNFIQRKVDEALENRKKQYDKTLQKVLDECLAIIQRTVDEYLEDRTRRKQYICLTCNRLLNPETEDVHVYLNSECFCSSCYEGWGSGTETYRFV